MRLYLVPFRKDYHLTADVRSREYVQYPTEMLNDRRKVMFESFLLCLLFSSFVSKMTKLEIKTREKKERLKVNLDIFVTYSTYILL